MTTANRCWTHCRTVSDAVLHILTYGATKKYYHIVGQEFSVAEIYNKICHIVGGFGIIPKEPLFIPFEKARPGHDSRYSLADNELCGIGWNWKAHNFEHELERTIKWMLQPQNKRWLQL